jgi:tetratricopeptide (TPR) repeat protein
MAHSLHTTRHDLEEAEKHRYADKRKGREAVERLEQELAAKRRTKWQVKAGRRKQSLSGLVPIEAIPIEIDTTSPHVDYGVTVDDLRALLGALPPGAADGLSVIRLEPGIEMQRHANQERGGELTADPFIGRLGHERLHNVYSGGVLGSYHPRTGKLLLYGFVGDPGRPDRAAWSLYLKLCLLTTFVHELAHHHDLLRRVARGRWRADDLGKVEKFAEGIEHAWTQSYVIPYLCRAYPAEVAGLESWMQEHLGVVLPLPLLVGDPRVTAKRDCVAFIATFFSTAQAFERSVRAIASGRYDAVAVRLELACDLHLAEEYRWAERIIESVLSVSSNHVDALTLKADILEHRAKHREAIAVARKAMALAPNDPGPLEVMADAYESLANWKQVIRLTDLMMMLYGDRTRQFGWALAQHARAALELGDLATARSDIARLSNGPRHFQRHAKRLEELLPGNRPR